MRKSSLSIVAQKYLCKCEDTYFILQNKYLCIYEDSFGEKILRDDCALESNELEERQVSINTAELASFVSETFVTRQSNIYYPYAYVNFAYPMNKEHCSIHCVFDPDDKCDFFFMWNVYCYLGNFNQPDYISSSQDSVTTYIYKGIKGTCASLDRPRLIVLYYYCTRSF